MEMSRRTALASGSAFALAAGLPTAAFAFPAWEARSGLSAADYQIKFDQMGAQGFRLLVVDGCTVGAATTFSAIWMMRSGPAWLARHNMTAADYQQAFDANTAQGYRPRWISSYAVAGSERYAAIWDKSGGVAWQARHGLTATAFQQAFDQMSAQGFRLTCVTGCQVNFMTTTYAGIWEKTPGPFYAYSSLSASDYQQKFDELGAQGFRLRQVKGYGALGVPRFAAIWDKDGSSAWEAHHNLTTAQFQQKFNDLTSAGFWLSDVSGYNMGGQVGYAGIWQKI